MEQRICLVRGFFPGLIFQVKNLPHLEVLPDEGVGSRNSGACAGWLPILTTNCQFELLEMLGTNYISGH